MPELAPAEAFEESRPYAAPAVDPIPDVVYDLVQSPSLFGRMLLIAAFLRVDDGAAPQHSRFHTPEIEEGVRKLQLEVFASWLALPLQRQKSDITVFINASPADRKPKVKDLVGIGEPTIPPEVKPAARQLFLQDLKIVQALFLYDR